MSGLTRSSVLLERISTLWIGTGPCCGPTIRPTENPTSGSHDPSNRACGARRSAAGLAYGRPTPETGSTNRTPGPEETVVIASPSQAIGRLRMSLCT